MKNNFFPINIQNPSYKMDTGLINLVDSLPVLTNIPVLNDSAEEKIIEEPLVSNKYQNISDKEKPAIIVSSVLA